MLAVTVAMMVAACSAQEPSPTDAAGRATEQPVSTSAPRQPTITPSATVESTRQPLDAMLPTELGGVELHTFPVGQDSMQRLASRFGLDLADLDVRYASEHGARFLQMYAIRAPGISAPDLIEAWAAVAYPAEVTDAAHSQQVIGRTAVRVSHAPSAAARLGTYYAFSLDDTLLVVQAFEPAVAAEAVAALSR